MKVMKALSLLLFLFVFSAFVPVHADSTTIEGPGFKLHKKTGWFGASERGYQDALGNTYSQKEGLFHQHKTEGSIFGSRIHTTNRETTVSGPNGQTMVSEKHTWFHGKQTYVNGNGIWQNIRDVFKQP